MNNNPPKITTRSGCMECGQTTRRRRPLLRLPPRHDRSNQGQGDQERRDKARTYQRDHKRKTRAEQMDPREHDCGDCPMNGSGFCAECAEMARILAEKTDDQLDKEAPP